jgi:hypothetical protein
MNGYKYRVLNKVGNFVVYSSETTLTVYTLPVVNNVTIIQCDDDLDAVTTFNLTVKNRCDFKQSTTENSHTTLSFRSYNCKFGRINYHSFSLYQHNSSIMKVWQESEY